MGIDPVKSPPAVVAVVASAGGVEALSSFVGCLSAEFQAAVLVVLHIPSQGPSVLPGILDRAGVLPARHAVDGDQLERGMILVAPPDRHLTVDDGMVLVSAGPKENGHRPSADVLLRSVAQTYGRRSAGVVLSGTMDDGAAGLRAVMSFGGLAIVQDPGEAAFPGMPTAAIDAADGAIVSGTKEMGRRLEEWLDELGEPLRDEAPLTADDPPDTPRGEEISVFTCPDCGGSLWSIDDGGAERYRCRIGHAFSGDSLLLGKQNAVEAAVWAAIVALEEKADLCRRIAKRLEAAGRISQLRRYRQDIQTTEQQVGLLRRMVDELLVTSTVIEQQGGTGAGSAP